MEKQIKNILIAVFAAALLLLTSVFTVNEGEKGIVLRLGEIIQNDNSEYYSYNPGIHIKLPFIEQVKKFDVRLRTFNVPSSRILTKEQKMVHVDYYVKWRIKNVAKYYKTTNGLLMHAQRLMEQRINNALRASFGERTISDVISAERENIMTTLRDKANENSENLGIEVVDVRLKRIDLPKEVSISVYQRMRADREKVATKYRSDGRSQAEKIRATADADVTVILATAKADSASIRAKGDGEAATIYNSAYEKDSKFYNILRSLQAYENSFNSKKDFLVLKPNIEYFKYFHGINEKNTTNYAENK
ncbi:MAG: protease modulator HflC [Legionellales bacterium]|jgi:modulator of FtsH protease HflC|nr:protease modulator HflC [Legionellales bacterium]